MDWAYVYDNSSQFSEGPKPIFYKYTDGENSVIDLSLWEKLNEQARKKKDELTDLVERGMKAVHQKLRQDKIKNGEPLVISRDGRVIVVDPKTMEEIRSDK